MAQGEVIRRKLAETRAADFAAQLPGVDKMLPLALARAARDCFQLGLDVRSLTNRQAGLGELLETVPDLSLVAVLEGPGDSLGVMVLSPDLLAGLIEVQTLGRVMAGPAGARRPTRTDATMVAEWIDAALAEFERALEVDLDRDWTAGFRYASFLEEARPLGLLLEDTSYRLLRAEVDLARGAKQGSLLLALPAEAKGKKAKAKARELAKAAERAVFVEEFTESVLSADCQLQALIGRVQVPLGQVLDFAADALLPLGEASINHILIESLEGAILAMGKLGQFRGNRAIRLTEIFGLGGTADMGGAQQGFAVPNPMAPPGAESVAQAEASAREAVGGAGDAPVAQDADMPWLQAG